MAVQTLFLQEISTLQRSRPTSIANLKRGICQAKEQWALGRPPPGPGALPEVDEPIISIWVRFLLSQVVPFLTIFPISTDKKARCPHLPR